MFTLPDLGYKYDELEPYIDARTMEIHYTKHHQAYVDKLNAIIEANPILKDKSLEELCIIPETKSMAGGHFNHSFFWSILSAHTDSKVPEEILQYKDEFNDKSLKLFGSGWVWLAKKDNAIEVITTPLQDSPFVTGYQPILGIDLWEHAYYLKYQNRRSEYIDAFWNVINWSNVKEKIK